MKAVLNHFLLLCIFCCLQACQSTGSQEKIGEELKEVVSSDTMRIVSLNGTITELLYEIGAEKGLVGVDVTSTYPAATSGLTNLGHIRHLNIEAVLALKPTLVLIDSLGAENPALEQIKAAGVRIETVAIEQNLEGAYKAASQLKKLLNNDFSLAKLRTKIDTNKLAIEKFLEGKTKKPSVLFIYARGSQMLMVAGKNTFAEQMITLAGGEHIGVDFESFKPLTPEALLAYKPEAILMFDSGLASMKPEDEDKTALESLLEVKGMEVTPAAKDKRIITMDGLYLSGFGPRASDAVLELSKKIYKEAI